MTVVRDYVTAGVLAVIAVAIFGLAVAAFTPPPEEVEAGEIEWGSCIQIQGLRAASGAFEMVSMDGVTMARASELGDGQIATDKYIYNYTVVKCTVDVIMTMGQSNSAYYGPLSAAEATPVPQPGTAWYWGDADSMPRDADSDISNCRIYDFIGPDGLRVGDKGPAECATYYEKTGHKVLWLSLGVPGKRIIAWMPGYSAWRCDLAWSEAMMPWVNQYFNVNKVWATWAQGESDANGATTEEDYDSRFEDLHQRVAEGQLGLSPDAWFIVCGRTAVMAKNGVDINAYLRDLPDLVEGVYLAIDQTLPDSFTVSNGKLNTDYMHYTQKGDNEIAVALATYIANWMESEGI